MRSDFSTYLWALKLGALVNLYFLFNLLTHRTPESDAQIVVPATILFSVSAYRCVFPNRYKDNVVFHDSAWSSTLVTRVLATFVEVSWIYQFSYLIRLLNLDGVAWIDALSWLMVIQVVISQIFVWGAILTDRLSLYFYEELGWGVIFLANTLASVYLYLSVDGLGSRGTLLELNLLFGLFYLPWQFVHLRALRDDAQSSAEHGIEASPITRSFVASQFRRACFERRRASDAESWGGIVGLTWMTAYWATLIPAWMDQVVQLTNTP